MNFQVNLDSGGVTSGLEINSYLLETCRVCVGSYDNFHIFYYVKYGGPEILQEKLQLKNYSFSVCLKKIIH